MKLLDPALLDEHTAWMAEIPDQTLDGLIWDFQNIYDGWVATTFAGSVRSLFGISDDAHRHFAPWPGLHPVVVDLCPHGGHLRCHYPFRDPLPLTVAATKVLAAVVAEAHPDLLTTPADDLWEMLSPRRAGMADDLQRAFLALAPRCRNKDHHVLSDFLPDEYEVT